MKKTIRLTPQAEAFLGELPETTQAEFFGVFRLLSETGRLEMPWGRKLNRDLFEVRVSDGGNAYRTIYCYAAGNDIWILSGFQKKTQQTPQKEIKKALKIKRRMGL